MNNNIEIIRSGRWILVNEVKSDLQVIVRDSMRM